MRFAPTLLLRSLLLPVVLMGTAAPLIAGQVGEQPQDKSAPDRPVTDRPVTDRPVTDRDVSAGDVVRTPISDLNLRKDDIPALLTGAQADPYGVAGLRKCSQLSAAVADLDAVLGDDIDVPQDAKQKVSAGRVAQAAVGAFIPFRGLIREISGANEQDRRLLIAIQAGVARRAFLKGYSQARGCRAPVRPVPALAQVQQAAAPIPKPAPSAKAAPSVRPQRSQKVQFTSQPVVQKVD